MKNQSENLLREYITYLIVEDGDGGGGGGDAGYGGDIGMGSSGGGGGSASWGALGKALKNVKDVTKAGVEKAGAAAKAAVGVSLEAALSTLIPFFRAEYGKITDKYKQSISAIDSKYRSAYDAVDSALGNADVSFFAFMLRPDVYLAKAFLQTVPGATGDAAKTLTGGKLDGFIDTLTSAANVAVKGAGTAAVGSGFMKDSFERLGFDVIQELNRKKMQQARKKQGGESEIIKASKIVKSFMSETIAMFEEVKNKKVPKNAPPEAVKKVFDELSKLAFKQLQQKFGEFTKGLDEKEFKKLLSEYQKKS